MIDTWTDSTDTLRDQIGVVVTAGPAYGARDAVGAAQGDTAMKVVLTDTYEANDGTLQDSLPVFYPGAETYEDAAGNLMATLAIGGQPDVDFTGWSSGSAAGIYTDGVTGGKSPTGCTVNLSFDPGEDPTLEITEATHTEDGIEAITFSLTAIGAGCGFELSVPSEIASEGQIWALNACVRVDGGDAEPQNVAVSLMSDVDQIAFDDGALQVGGNLAGSLRTVQGAAQADTTSVHGVLFFFLPAGTVVVTLAMKLGQIS